MSGRDWHGWVCDAGRMHRLVTEVVWSSVVR